MVVIGWLLDPGERDALLARFPPRWPDVVADHVTLQPRPPADMPLPRETAGEIIGEADDGAGVQALVVRIAERTDRADGSTYHLTWSIDLARGRQARESNDVIATLGWTPLDVPVPIRLTPARFGWDRKRQKVETGQT